MPMHFYTIQLGMCPCRAMATHEVFGPGNASYGKYCSRCAIRRQKELEKFWNDQSAEIQRKQIADTRHDR